MDHRPRARRPIPLAPRSTAPSTIFSTLPSSFFTLSTGHSAELENARTVSPFTSSLPSRDFLDSVARPGIEWAPRSGSRISPRPYYDHCTSSPLSSLASTFSVTVIKSVPSSSTTPSEPVHAPLPFRATPSPRHPARGGIPTALSPSRWVLWVHVRK